MKLNVKKIQDNINSQPCIFCGKIHSVDLIVRGNDVRPAIGYSFSDDTCEEFKQFVKNTITEEYARCGYSVTLL